MHRSQVALYAFHKIKPSQNPSFPPFYYNLTSSTKDFLYDVIFSREE